MKTLFTILLGLFLLAVTAVVGLSLVFYFSPGLQKKIVLQALSANKGVTADVEFVHFQLSKTEIRGLKISAGKESISLGSLEARYSLSGLLGKDINVELFKISALDLDVAEDGGNFLLQGFGGNASIHETQDAGSSTMIMKIPLQIGQVRADGSARLPDGVSLTFDLKMDDIKPSTAGAIGLDVDVLATAPDASFEKAELRLTGALHQTSEGVFDRLEGDVIARLLEAKGSDWVEARLRPRFEGNANEFVVVFDELQLSRGTTPLGNGTFEANGKRGEGGPWVVDFSTQINSDLALVSNLSIVPLAEPLSSGKLEGRFSGQITEGNQASAQGTLEIRELRPVSYQGRALSVKLQPKLVANMVAETLELSTPLRLVGPATVTSGSISTKLVEGAAGRQVFDAAIVLDEFFLDEWQPLQALFAKDEPAVVSERDSTPDEQAPWSELEGQAIARIDRLRIGSNVMNDISATIKIENGQTVLAELVGRSGQSPLKANAEITFNPAQAARPYSLKGDLDIQGVDVGSYLKTPGTNKPVILEGIFNANGKFRSTAPNLAFLMDQATGDFLLQSAGRGTFRPLGEQTSLASGISGILGALGGGNKQVGWVQEVINQLKEIPFTQMSFRMGRGDNLDLFLKEFDLVSRETRIRGDGILQYKEGASLMQLPIDLRFNLFAKGKLAEALRNGSQLLSEEPDAMGFLPGPPLPLRGSLAQPESLLVNLLMDSGSQLLPGLLGPRK